MTIRFTHIIDFLWMAFAAFVLIALTAKAWIDHDPSWDTWYYHLPYAGRLWGIIPAESYRMEQDLEHYYLGFPKLGEWLQGLFWTVTGRVQAANLVCLLSLVIYAAFLRCRFGVPFRLSILALLAIPLVHIHVTSCYVDLPGNFAASALALLTWQLFHRDRLNPPRDIAPLFLPALIAAHYKFQLMIAVFALLLIALARIGWLIYYHRPPGSRDYAKICRWVALVCVMALLIFAVPIKNVLFYGNPFYPIRVAVGPIVLNHRIPYHQTSPPYLRDALPPERWLTSVLELDRPFATWQIGQLCLPVDSDGNRMGGFFGAYVVAQIAFLLVLGIGARPIFTDHAVPFMALISVLVSWFPLSHELRYYLFWMITLVSINLVLLCRGNGPRPFRLIIPVTNFTALVAVIVLTKGYYTAPQGITFDKLPAHLKQLEPFPFVPASLDQERLARINPGDELCIAGQQPITWLYASYFHPQKKSYRVIAALDEQSCE